MFSAPDFKLKTVKNPALAPDLLVTGRTAAAWPAIGESETMNRMPDFIVMGAMKSATSTLHEQLSEQEGFFMTEEKEPNFFSNDEIYAKGLEWYASLFANAAPGDLCGESSTHYTKLPTYPHTVARMRAALPQRQADLHDAPSDRPADLALLA